MLNNLLGLVALACAVWVIYEVWMVQKNKNTVEKLIWTVAALVFSILTAIVYYFTVKKKIIDSIWSVVQSIFHLDSSLKS